MQLEQMKRRMHKQRKDCRCSRISASCAGNLFSPLKYNVSTHPTSRDEPISPQHNNKQPQASGISHLPSMSPQPNMLPPRLQSPLQSPRMSHLSPLLNNLCHSFIQEVLEPFRVAIVASFDEAACYSVPHVKVVGFCVFLIIIAVDIDVVFCDLGRVRCSSVGRSSIEATTSYTVSSSSI